MVNSTQGFYSLMGLQPGTLYHLVIMHENNTQWEAVALTTGPGASFESRGLFRGGRGDVPRSTELARETSCFY